MKINVAVSSTVPLTTRMRQVCSMFDCPASAKTSREWAGELPIEDRAWQIGLIVGPSGCGKTTIARQLFGEPATLTWPENASVIDGFSRDLSIEDVASACSAVGFNTIPSWLRPHAVLSNGEKFRVELARLLVERVEGVLIVDEFTSVVDRQVAQIGSHAVQKYVRKREALRFVAASCHYDIVDWLQPDWILEPASMAFAWRSLQRRPSLELEIKRAPWSLWRVFAPYHYLTAELHKAARCFAAYVKGQPVAFAAMLPIPVSNGARAGEVIWRVSRMVTLPDWQGLGIAFVLMEELGSAYAAIGKRMRTYPAHPSFVRTFQRNAKWRQTKEAGVISQNKTSAAFSNQSFGDRPCAVFEYAGGAKMTEREARRLIATG